MFDTKIKLVKLMRSAFGFGLVDCAKIVDIWGEAYGLSNSAGWYIEDWNAITKLLVIGRMVKSGEWVIEGNKIKMTKELMSHDIVNLS